MSYMPVYPIETERLRLRPFTRGDVDAVFSYRSREDVAQYLFDEPMSRESCAEAVHARIGQVTLQNEGDKILIAVERRDTLAMIGEVSLIWRSAENRQGEVGYILNPAHHGHGYATEAARAMIWFGFDTLGLHRIYARCDVRNTSSAKVMERLGMRREAHFRQHVRVKGSWDEELIYAILEDEWRALRTASPLRQ